MQLKLVSSCLSLDSQGERIRTPWISDGGLRCGNGLDRTYQESFHRFRYKADPETLRQVVSSIMCVEIPRKTLDDKVMETIDVDSTLLREWGPFC